MMKSKRVFNLIKDSITGWSENEAPLYAAALAYYTIFSLAPLLIITTAIAASIFNEAAVQGKIVQAIERFVGPEIAIFIEDIIKNSYSATSGTVATIIGISILLYGASTIFYKLQLSLNAMWGIVLKPGNLQQSIITTVKARLLAAAAVLAIGFLLLGSLLLTTILTALPRTLLAQLPINLEAFLPLISFLASPVILTLIFAVIFESLPGAKIRWRDVWPGAAVTAVLFWIGGYLIGIYLGRSGIASIYGAAGSLVVFLLWAYYSAWIFLFGAKFTQVYADKYGLSIVPDDNAMFKLEPQCEKSEPSV